MDWVKIDKLADEARAALKRGDRELFDAAAHAYAVEFGCQGEGEIKDFIKSSFFRQTPEEREAAMQWWRDYDMRLSYEDFYEERRAREEMRAACREG